MRGGRSFLILLVLALGLGGYAYFVESKRTGTADQTAKLPKVFTVEEAKVEEIEAKAPTGEVTRLKKDGNGWKITAPESMDTDEETVSSVVSQLASLEISKTVDENPASMKDFELDPPKASVKFRLTGETTMKELDLGGKTPTGSDVYARVAGQPKLFLVPASSSDQLSRTTFDLRDKSVLKFDHDKTDALTLEVPAAPKVLLAKANSEWRLTAPGNAKADFSSVDTLLVRLAAGHMKTIAAADGTKDLKKYGLDKPQLVATVGQANKTQSLAFGGKADEGSVYARDASRPLVFTVEKALLDDLTKKPNDVRDRTLFEFKSYTALSVDIFHGGDAFTFVKQKTPPPPNQSAATTAEVWKQTKPAAKDVDQAKVTDWLSSVSALRATDFADRALASGDDYTLAVKFGDEKTPQDEHVTLRKLGTVVQAIRPGEPGAAIVDTAEFDKAVAALKDITGGK